MRCGIATALLATLAAACGGEEPASSSCPEDSGRLVVTADWLNRSLTLFDAARLAEPACEEQVVGTIDLADYAPGPLELEIAPDGNTAVVAVGPGFLPGLAVSEEQVVAGGSVLVVDLSSRAVVHAIETPQAPMGLAISPDGRWAYSANYGDADVVGNTLTVIDIEAGSIVESYEVGARPEQVALAVDGASGIVNAAEDGTIRTFSAEGPTLTLSDPLEVGGDPSDVTFAGATRAVVTQSIAWSYSLIDTSDPEQPSVLGEHPTTTGIPYGATAIGDEQILVTTFLAEATVLWIDLTGEPQVLTEIPLPGTAFTLGAAVDAEGRYAYVPQPNDQRLSIVDLESGTTHSIQWLTEPGPTYVALQL